MKARQLLGLLVLCTGLTVTNSYAQEEGLGRNFFNKENDERVFFGGLVAGANFTTVNGDTYDGYHKLGLNGGGIVYIKLSKSFLASMQLLYTQRGSRGVNVYDSYYTGTTIDKYYLDLNYVEVPLIFHYLLNDKWQIGIGASYSQLLTSNEEAYSAVPTYFNAPTQQFRKQDFEYILSGTMQLYRGWFLDATYQYSMQTIRDADKIPIGYTTGGGQYNGLFSLRLVRLIN